MLIIPGKSELHSRKQVFVQHLQPCEPQTTFFRITFPSSVYEKPEPLSVCIIQTVYFPCRNNSCTWLLARKTASLTFSRSLGLCQFDSAQNPFAEDVFAR